MKSLVFISIILSAKSCFGLVCYSCNSGQNPKCGEDMVDLSTIGVSQCKDPSEFCVTFYNRFDNNNIYRGCSGIFYVPEELETVNNTCVLDSFTKSLFCSCNDKDFCNQGKIGSLEIAKKDAGVISREVVDPFVVFSEKNFDYCQVYIANELKCVNGKPVSNAEKQTCTCECEQGFSGKLCDTETFQCPGVGTFPDPKFCWIYYTCSPGATGFDKTTNSCPFKILETTELLFQKLLFQYNPDTKTGTCTFPSLFTNYAGQTCSVN